MKWLTRVIIAVAFVTQMLVMWPSGSRYCTQNRCGDFYWGVHEHDGIWHMALAETAFESGSLQMPTFAGAKLTGYNWLIDYPMFALSKIGVPVAFSYFKLLPTIWFVLMIWVWRKFANQYQPGDERYFQWLLFWLFFSNSLSYVFSLWHFGTLIGGGSYLSMQPPMVLSNLQFAYTLPILGYILLILGKVKKNWYDNWVIALLLFTAMGLKFYGGAVLLALVVIHSVLFKNWKRIFYALVAIAAAVVLFYQPKVGQGAIISVNPMATVYPIIEEKLLFYSPKLSLARYSDSLIKQGIAGAIALAIFIIFNFATRLVAIYGWKKWNRYEWSVMLGVIVALGANVLLVQRGEWWNTVQFLYYGFFLIAVLCAKQMSEWSSKAKWVGVIVGGIIVLSSLPNTIDTWRVFVQYPPGSYISDQEKEILTILKEQPNGIVLALPLERSESGGTELPSPLYLRYESAYVSAYTGKVSFFNDTVQARLVGIDYQEREQSIKRQDCKILDQIKYIYLAGDQTQIEPWSRCDKRLNLIKQNESATLYIVE
ncbi:hypothetical protein KBD75_03225 [Candidatus Woesebacteria bacterium]|nr:hypothetical protein [Candidatus Woesebacteria bacterium]